MKVEIDSGNLLTLQILAAVLQTDIATVTNDCIVWHLTLPLGNRGVTFLASSVKEPFESPDWIFETKLDGYRAIAVPPLAPFQPTADI